MSETHTTNVEEIILKTANTHIDLDEGNHVSVKAYKDQDIRRFAFHKNGKFQQLVSTLMGVFNLEEGQLIIKYTDDEGDLVLLSSDTELHHAIQLSLQEAKSLQKPTATMKMHLEDSTDTTDIDIDQQSVSSVVSNDTQNAEDETTEFSPELQEQLDALESHELVRIFSDLPTRHVPDHVIEKIIKGRLHKLKEGDEDDFGDVSNHKWKPNKGFKHGSRHGHRHNHNHSHGSNSRWVKNDEQSDNSHSHGRGRGRGRGRGGNSGKNTGGGRMQARFVKHSTMGIDETVAPNQQFTKTWVMRNESETPWPKDCHLLFVSKKNGDLMGAPEKVDVVGGVEPGQEQEVSVPMVAPEKEGSYCGFWRLADKESGKKFGQRIQCRITVLEEATTTTSTTRNSGDYSSSDSSSEEEDQELDEALQELEGLGFKNMKQNMRLLSKFDGNLDAVIAKLNKKKEKQEKREKKKEEQKRK
eukprot:TRINITY_DN1949_c0_g1_i5.p1 TRINITY_DN1949_c0_g1~~TRINITY_DN1949_c0_g1_i5.p1  ORF type:complete len:495 (+),score=156.56 TRINITY_DN1949_c0_g1_i5:76-1485(+)